MADGMAGGKADAGSFGSGSRGRAPGTEVSSGAVQADEEVRGRRCEGEAVDNIAYFAREVEKGRWHSYGEEQ
jgi:hypothetical protein